MNHLVLFYMKSITAGIQFDCIYTVMQRHGFVSARIITKKLESNSNQTLAEINAMHTFKIRYLGRKRLEITPL